MKKNIRRLFLMLFTAATVLACSQSEAPLPMPGADTVLRNGNIYTVDTK